MDLYKLTSPMRLKYSFFDKMCKSRTSFWPQRQLQTNKPRHTNTNKTKQRQCVSLLQFINCSSSVFNCNNSFRSLNCYFCVMKTFCVMLITSIKKNRSKISHITIPKINSLQSTDCHFFSVIYLFLGKRDHSENCDSLKTKHIYHFQCF